MMDFVQALAAADEKRAQLESEWGTELVWPDDGEPWQFETEWCWYFEFAGKKHLETGDDADVLFGAGPIVVNKDGSEVWSMGSGPVAAQLRAYAQAHGFPVDPA